MHRFGVRDVGKLLRLPCSTIPTLVAGGFLFPARGPRDAWRFSFQDLSAHSTPFGHLFHQHPAGDTTGIRPPVPWPFGRGGRSEATQAGHCYSAGALGVNVRALSLRFDSPLRVIERGDAEARPGGEDWFARGVALESEDAESGRLAYRQAIAAAPTFLDAYINLGSLLHASCDRTTRSNRYTLQQSVMPKRAAAPSAQLVGRIVRSKAWNKPFYITTHYNN
ncbi:hypothetical protein [Thiocapsa sp.]|uniref:hypothetical protein n=1 Tax=Thiocapsa sp. TaxID=2024551 RepID=UPI0035936AF5